MSRAFGPEGSSRSLLAHQAVRSPGVSIGSRQRSTRPGRGAAGEGSGAPILTPPRPLPAARWWVVDRLERRPSWTAGGGADGACDGAESVAAVCRRCVRGGRREMPPGDERGEAAVG